MLDFIEEFRQPVVDRVVFAMINKRFKVEWEDPDNDAAKATHQSSKPDAETEIPTQRRLSQATRRALADRVLARLQETERFERKAQKLCNIIQLQARHLAMHPTPRKGISPLHRYMVKRLETQFFPQIFAVETPFCRAGRKLRLFFLVFVICPTLLR